MTDDSTRGATLAPLTGVLFVVLTVVGLALAGDTPDADAPRREVVRWWVDHDTQSIVGTLLESLGAVALLFFAASLYRALRRRDTGSGILPLAAFAGGAVAAAGIGVDAAIRFALADLADDVPPEVTQTLNALWGDFFFPMIIGLGTLILATSLAALKTRIIPVWLAWIGILVFIALFTPAGFLAFLVGGIWVIVLSIVLWRQAATATATV